MKSWIEIPKVAPNSMVWRYLVIERNEHICQNCGENGSIAHHISSELKWRLYTDVGIALCDPCHRRIKRGSASPVTEGNPFANRNYLECEKVAYRKFILDDREV